MLSTMFTSGVDVVTYILIFRLLAIMPTSTISLDGYLIVIRLATFIAGVRHTKNNLYHTPHTRGSDSACEGMA